MDVESKKISIQIKDKEYKIESINEHKLLINKIKSILEDQFKLDLAKAKNLYKIYYLDEDGDKLYIKSQEDYNYFVNSVVTKLYLEIDESVIENLKKEETPPSVPSSSSKKELELLETIRQLTKANEELKKEKEIYSQISQIYKDKINILEEDQRIKDEKEKSIMNTLENEKKEKYELIEQLEEVQKLNKSISLINNNLDNNSNHIDNNENEKDVLLNNLMEEKTLLKKHLDEERKKIDLYEKIYQEDNNKLKEKINNLKNDFDLQKQQILKNSEIVIKKEIEKGINDFINKSKINLENKENEINMLKNDYENKINLIREECYKEVEEKYSKIYEEKIKQIYDTAMNNSKVLYNNIMSQNQKEFEAEEKKRNEIMNSKILIQSNLSKLSQCSTVHTNIACNECKMSPIVGYRYKCLECLDYNLCENCEKTVEHEHNFIKYVNEQKNFVGANNNIYSYACLSSNLSVSTYEGTPSAKLNIILKNNGSKKWTNDTLLTILSNGKNSLIKCNNIKLKELEPGQQDLVEIPFNNLESLRPASYTIIFMFSVNEKIYGETLKVRINILRKP